MTSLGYTVAVAGASGYAGGEVLRLLAAHPHVEIGAVTAHGNAGQPVTDVHPQLRQLSDRYFCATEVEELAAAEAVVMTLPHGHSAELARQLPSTTKIVDLGADHRLVKAVDWDNYYSGPHAGAWTYGLPELPGQREVIAASQRVAATGCYAVSTTLAAAPLLDSGIAMPEDIVVVAASGTSGAGRTAKAHLMASEVVGSLSPYKVGAHQHIPEIKQATRAVSLSFTPVLAPMPRGILATVTLRPADTGVSAGEVAGVLNRSYRGETFVEVLAEGNWPRTADTYGTNSCLMQATVDKDAGRIIVTSAIDNLGKGAAGQVVQCLNLMMSQPEASGLSVNGVAP